MLSVEEFSLKNCEQKDYVRKIDQLFLLLVFKSEKSKDLNFSKKVDVLYRSASIQS